jgi:Zn-dependent M28 family amino/carboxypeptidase
MTACVQRGRSYAVTMESSQAFIALIIIVTIPASGSQRPGPGTVNDEMQAALRAHVTKLAGDIGERNVFRPQALRRASAYIEQTWQAQGYNVARQEYQTRGETVANLEVTRKGIEASAGIVVVGAHYDSVAGSPGANDNGTGVAALLEIARRLTTGKLCRTVHLVAFVNEEPPFFKTPSMGSRVYTKMARARDDDIRAMLCLETIGYYSNAPDSQHYPPLFNLFYPERGNFIGFVSNFRSRPLLKQAVAAFRAASDFPLEYASTFSFIPGVDWSDHWAFWRKGIPALMVTDTAPYRYPYYHSSLDTADKVNYPQLARVTEGLVAVVMALAQCK